jgi:BirA family transcriptional regulator, biotin operon repressor / biotin---[acetyl-CoA-carboxylase] ligase
MSALDSSIICAFLEADGQPVSGDHLAKDLGVSRVAIWGRLEKLRAAGFIFTASPRKGYILKEVPQVLHPTLLDAHCRRLKVSLPIEYFESTDSTNSEAERQLANGKEAPFVVLAQSQTAGRGRLGRKWHSSDKGNIYLSLALRPFILPDRLKPFTLWMGLALCRYIEDGLGIKLGLKWPNDILSPEGKKIAGILTEARLDADTVRDLIFGLGLNISPQQDFPDELKAIASSLTQATGDRLDVNSLTAGIIKTTYTSWEEFKEERWANLFKEYWNRYDILTGKVVTIQLRGQPVTGMVEGIDEYGSLKIKTSDEKTVLISSGEVTLGS